MEGIEYIYELCELLPRSGPGDKDSTRRAYNSIPQRRIHPAILDIGCGQGMQTIELAKISKGKITAIDNHQGFLDILLAKAKLEAVDQYIYPQNMSMLDMNFDNESFDIIWSEGALYIMGFENGLKRCHQLLKPLGSLAVTELVYTSANPPKEVVDYFTVEYPDISEVNSKIEQIKSAGYNLISHYTLPESSWLDNYYLPMEKVLPNMIEKYRNNEIALSVLNSFKIEINFYKTYSKFYGYEFFIMQKA